MNRVERLAVVNISLIMSLRMLGLFMVLPLFSLYVAHLAGATPTLIGLSLGIYGLTQALLQIPFGMTSDFVGRKKVIGVGFGIFISGSILCALAKSIDWMIVGRALQGAGAVGSTLIALLTDLTAPRERSKAMAIMGMTIGLSFSLAMILGPLWASWLGVSGIFWLAALFGAIAIFLLIKVVPTPAAHPWHVETEVELAALPSVLRNSALARLNFGIFILHAIFTSSFIVIPLSLQQNFGWAGSQQWTLYLPILLLAFLLSIPAIVIAEKRHLLREFFLGAIVLLGCAEGIAYLFNHHHLLFNLSLLLLLTAFSILEAFIPSLVSRTAPAQRKGTALGIYSFAQFFGIFIGGTAGGWLYGQLGLHTVYLAGAIAAFIWLALAFGMKNPQTAAKV